MGGLHLLLAQLLSPGAANLLSLGNMVPSS